MSRRLSCATDEQCLLICFYPWLRTNRTQKDMQSASEPARMLTLSFGNVRVRAMTLYSWLQGKSRPASAGRIIAFLDSMPKERGGIIPTGYEYREYKNWRGIPKPRRCPFCEQAKGEIRKVRGGYQGVCPNWGATGPKREGYDRALLAWNGKGFEVKLNQTLVWSMFRDVKL